MTIDLTKFCSTEDWRPCLHNPFSFGPFTYASNGHLAIRIARTEAVIEANKEQQKMAKAIDKFLAEREPINPTPLSLLKLPEPTESEECETCDGSGNEHHACPDCQCECDDCDGKGVRAPERWIGFQHAHLQEKYVRLLLELPNIRISLDETSAKTPPLPFIFDDGVGIIMPSVGNLISHVDMEKIIEAEFVSGEETLERAGAEA